MDYPSLANCSGEYVVKALVRIGGFDVKKGSKHFWKVCHIKSNKCFVVQNRRPLKKGLMWALVREFLRPLGYTEEEIFKELWC